MKKPQKKLRRAARARGFLSDVRWEETFQEREEQREIELEILALREEENRLRAEESRKERLQEPEKPI